MGYGPTDTLKDLGKKLEKSVVFFSIVMVLMLAIPFAMVIMGALNLDECDAEPMIPIYMIVAGVFTVFRSLLAICNRRVKDSPDDRNKMDYFLGLIDCFLFAWFIAGCVFIYRTKDDFQSHDTSKSAIPGYCDYTFYWFSFWITTLNYIIMGVILLLLIVAMCCAAC